MHFYSSRVADHFSFTIIHYIFVFISANGMDEELQDLEIAILAARNINEISFLVLYVLVPPPLVIFIGLARVIFLRLI